MPTVKEEVQADDKIKLGRSIALLCPQTPFRKQALSIGQVLWTDRRSCGFAAATLPGKAPESVAKRLIQNLQKLLKKGFLRVTH